MDHAASFIVRFLFGRAHHRYFIRAAGELQGSGGSPSAPQDAAAKQRQEIWDDSSTTSPGSPLPVGRGYRVLSHRFAAELIEITICRWQPRDVSYMTLLPPNRRRAAAVGGK